MAAQLKYATISSTVDGGSATVDWVSPSNAEDAGDTTYASCPMDLAYSEVSFDLLVSGYAFTIPVGSTVGSIAVTIGKYADTPTELNPGVLDDEVSLTWEGAAISENRASAMAWPSEAAAAHYGLEGGENVLWGLTEGGAYSQEDIVTMLNDGTNFGVLLRAVSGIGGSEPTEYYNTAYVDYVSITVTYTPPGGAGGAGRGCIL